MTLPYSGYLSRPVRSEEEARRDAEAKQRVREACRLEMRAQLAKAVDAAEAKEGL